MLGDAPDAGDSASGPRHVPVDLVAVVVLVGFGTLSVLVPPLSESPLRVVLALPLVFLLPGYAVVSALFPRGSSDTGRADGPLESGGLDTTERLVVAVPCSVALVTLVALALIVSPVPADSATVSVTVSALTLGAVVVAVRQRGRLPADERHRVVTRSSVPGIRAALGRTSGTSVPSVLVVVCVVFALGAVTFAVAAPNEGETFTEFYLLAENGSDELTAADSPVEYANDSSPSLVVGVSNHEGRTVDYTVVVRLRRANATEATETDRFSVAVPDSETRRREHVLELPSDGRYRAEFLLYRGDVAADPPASAAYRRTTVWVTRDK